MSKYKVWVNISGFVCKTVEADDPEEAYDLASSECNYYVDNLEIDEIHSYSEDSVELIEEGNE